MAKERLCTKCNFNKNGWCQKLKTNKNLKDLTKCEFREESMVLKLKEHIALKELELKVNNNSFNRGIIQGLKIALLAIEK